MKKLSFACALIAVLIVGPIHGQGEGPNLREQSPNQLAREGYRFSQEDAVRLEKSLETHPDDLSARTRLLGYYFAKSLRVSGAAATIDARRRHILWIIRNHPDAEIAGLSEATLDPKGHSLADKKGYEQAKGVWVKQTEAHKENTLVLGNAAKFFKLHDKELAEGVLRKAQAVEPDNSEWSARLGYLYALGILGVNGLNQNGLPTSFDLAEAEGEFAKKAREGLEESSNALVLGTTGSILFQYGSILQGMLNRKLEPETVDFAEGLLKKAQELEPNAPQWPMMLGQLNQTKGSLATSPEEKQAATKSALEAMEKSAALVDKPERLYALVELAKAAFEAGETGKAEATATELLEMASQLRDDSFYGTAVHHGNLILGRLALKEGSREKAKTYLIKAGQTPGGGTLGSFGPNMALAKELLELGEKDAVLEYLELCKNFWNSGVKRGTLKDWIETIKAGGIPEFGPNLIY